MFLGFKQFSSLSNNSKKKKKSLPLASPTENDSYCKLLMESHVCS